MLLLIEYIDKYYPLFNRRVEVMMISRWKCQKVNVSNVCMTASPLPEKQPCTFFDISVSF
jgi:hypothetical protein